MAESEEGSEVSKNYMNMSGSVKEDYADLACNIIDNGDEKVCIEIDLG